jgi:outer membrane murein-binding lipoprotein Lpp
MRVAAAAVVGGLLLQGCGGEAEARRGRLEVQRVHLEASLDRLEARLLDGQARVRGWEEHRRRHGRVTAVACEVNGRHAADMARLAEEERWLAAGRGAPRLAAGARVDPGAAGD